MSDDMTRDDLINRAERPTTAPPAWAFQRNEQLRQEIADQTAAFLARGGEIEVIGQTLQRSADELSRSAVVTSFKMYPGQYDKYRHRRDNGQLHHAVNQFIQVDPDRRRKK